MICIELIPAFESWGDCEVKPQEAGVWYLTLLKGSLTMKVESGNFTEQSNSKSTS